MPPAEYQPYSSYETLGVPAQQVTNLKLSGGLKIPFIYSLGVNSTIPYVRLIGSATGQKLFTWNEKIIVPAGEMVTVQNASFHPGDIFLQSGWDPGAKPERVTVPVGVTLDTNNPDEAFHIITPDFQVDTRRCRRAFIAGLGLAGDTAGIEYQVVVSGTSKFRSHNTNPTFSSEGAGARARYTTLVSVPPGGASGLIPLGEDSQFGDSIHSLLDVATWTWNQPGFETQSGAVHYVLEYL